MIQGVPVNKGVRLLTGAIVSIRTVQQNKSHYRDGNPSSHTIRVLSTTAKVSKALERTVENVAQ